MKRLRWQLIIIFLTGLVVGILLLGEQPSSTVAGTPQPVKGGIYTEAIVGSPQRMNPLLDSFNPVDRDVDALLFGSLIRFDSHGLPLANLARDWGISQDGTLYNFTLRTDARWHDGEPFTSADVLFTIDLIRKSDGVLPEDLRNFWKSVDVKAGGDDKIQFKLPEPFAPFLDYLTFGILPQHLLNGISFKDLVNAPFNLQPVGTGPYKFDHLIVEDNEITGVVLKANDKYFNNSPFIDQFIFHYYPDSGSALKAYQDGTVQGIGQVTGDILPGVLAEKNLALYTGRKPELAMILFNTKNPQVPFLGDSKVRHALMIGINRQWIIDRILQGQAILANGPIFPDTWAYYDGLEPVDFDTDQAISQLKEAGYVVAAQGDNVRQKDGQALKFDLLYPDDEQHKAIAESIQRDWALVNVEVTLTPRPYDQLINEDLGNRQYQAALIDLNLSHSPDPDPYPFWDQAQATGGQNYTQWDNRSASEYIEQARVAIRMSDRLKLYRNFQVIFNQDLPAIPLYYPVYSYAVDRQVLGVQMGPLFDTSDRFDTINKWYLRSGPPGHSAVSVKTPIEPVTGITPAAK